MFENLLELNFTISKYSFSSFGTGILALFIFIVSLIFYFLIERDKVLPYTMSIELAMFFYMFSYGLGTSSMTEANVVFWYKIMYVNIIIILFVSLLTIAFLANKPIKLMKSIFFGLGMVVILIVIFSDKIITNKVEYVFHLTPIKGSLYWVYLLYSLVGVLFIVYTIVIEFIKKKEVLKSIWPIYIGLLFFLLHMYYSAITSVLLRVARARLSINVLFYAFMIIIFFYIRIRNNIRNREQLFNRYIYDDLTLVYSRNYFYELLKKDITIRNTRVIIGMIDMNKFKYINDTFGHLVGDDVLIKVGNLLVNMNPDIKVGRIGGDEFLLYTTKTTEEELKKEIKEVMISLDEYLTHKGLNENCKELGLSFGYAIHNNQMTYNELVSACDKAMYLSKTKGNYTITKFHDGLV